MLPGFLRHLSASNVFDFFATNCKIRLLFSELRLAKAKLEVFIETFLNCPYFNVVLEAEGKWKQMMLAPNGKRERKFGPCLTASPHQSLCRDVFIKSHITAFFKSLINVFIKSHRINHSVKMSLSSHHRILTFETHLPSISPADHFFLRRPSGLSVPPPSCQQMIINLRKIGNFRKIPPHVVKISIPPRDIAAKVNGDRFDNGIFPRRKKC